jgi:hypothetical protein
MERFSFDSVTTFVYIFGGDWICSAMYLFDVATVDLEDTYSKFEEISFRGVSEGLK